MANGRGRRRLGPTGEAPAADQLRRRLCQECARIMAEEGLRDFQAAKRKAAARLGLGARRDLPSNREIEDALREYLDLFHRESLHRHLRQGYALALEAMRSLVRFQPRAVGELLRGTVSAHSPVQLHVFADPPEEVNWHLQESGIPFEVGERRLRFSGDRYRVLPVLRFTADGRPVELVIFPVRDLREPPLSPVDGRPMRRVGPAELETLAALI